MGLLLIEADYILPALRDSYARIDGIRGKSDALLVCHALIKAVHGGQSEEALKRLMGVTGTASKDKILVNAGLREDYEAFFEDGEIGEGEITVLRRIRDEDAASDLVGPFVGVPKGRVSDDQVEAHGISNSALSAPLTVLALASA